jgi:hypothetical protein
MAQPKISIEATTTVTDVVKIPFWRQMIANPVSAYMKVGRFTFGIVAVTNFFTFLKERHYEDGQVAVQKSALVESPNTYTMAIMTKSVFYLYTWPAFYITALTNPKDAFSIRNKLAEFRKLKKETMQIFNLLSVIVMNEFSSEKKE